MVITDSNVSNYSFGDVSFGKGCDSCIHSKVCKFKDEFQKSKNAILDKAALQVTSEIINVSVECVCYSAIKTNFLTSTTINTSTDSRTYTGTETHYSTYGGEYANNG